MIHGCACSIARSVRSSSRANARATRLERASRSAVRRASRRRLAYTETPEFRFRTSCWSALFRSRLAASPPNVQMATASGSARRRRPAASRRRPLATRPISCLPCAHAHRRAPSEASWAQMAAWPSSRVRGHARGGARWSARMPFRARAHGPRALRRTTSARGRRRGRGRGVVRRDRCCKSGGPTLRVSEGGAPHGAAPSAAVSPAHLCRCRLPGWRETYGWGNCERRVGGGLGDRLRGRLVNGSREICGNAPGSPADHSQQRGRPALGPRAGEQEHGERHPQRRSENGEDRRRKMGEHLHHGVIGSVSRCLRAKRCSRKDSAESAASPPFLPNSSVQIEAGGERRGPPPCSWS